MLYKEKPLQDIDSAINKFDFEEIIDCLYSSLNYVRKAAPGSDDYLKAINKYMKYVDRYYDIYKTRYLGESIYN